MYIGVGIVPTGPSEMSVYYMENYQHPSARLRRGALRLDGFVSVNAPWRGGEFVTRPLTFAGKELFLNRATSVSGSIRVEVQDTVGRPLEGYHLCDSAEIFGDETERVVSWREGSDASALADEPVRLRFVMKDADLFAMRFR